MAITAAAGTVEVLTMVFGCLSLLLLILCAGSDCWRQDAKDPFSSVSLSLRCRGLRSECIFDNVATLWTCDISISYLNEHPAVLVSTRVLVILSGFLVLSAMPPFVAGLSCTKLFSDTTPQKRNCTFASGTLFLLGGLLGAIAVFWYGIDTAQKYKQEVSFGIPGMTYELGCSYWMATVGVACAAASGVLLLAITYFHAQMPGKERHFRHPLPVSNCQGTYL